MTEVTRTARVRTADAALRARARAVIPGGMYGHLSANALPAEYPQFYDRAEGAHVWDVDGNEYVDFMCSFGPMLLGHNHPAVEAAAAAQRAKGDTMSGPGAAMVEAAELLTSRVEHADWAMFAKNGTDATTIALMVARAATGRSKILAAKGAYHGGSPMFTPRDAGVTAEDRANFRYYTFNDLMSVEKALADAGAEDVAGIIVSPYRHDAGFDQELTDAEFARGLRAICDRIGAALIMDEVRGGFRLHDGGSWEPIGVVPDLSGWSKAIANGYPLAATLGRGQYADAASQIFVTGSFWYQAVPHAACVATLNAVRDEGAVETMIAMGTLLREGLAREAEAAGVVINQSGPVQMPNLSFSEDENFAKAQAFCAAAIEHGTIFHPRHNWFLSGAHTTADVERAVAAGQAGFRAVAQQFGGD